MTEPRIAKSLGHPDFDLTREPNPAPWLGDGQRSFFRFSAKTIDRANLACRALALLILLTLTVPIAIKRNIPQNWIVDFPQYYMGGTVALHGQWMDIYPIGKPGSLYNPGDANESTMRPAYARLATERGVPDSHRFIQAPPVALLLAPLGLMSYNTSAAVWVTLCAVCAWGIAWIAGAFYELLAQRRSLAAGIITLVIVLMPGTRRAMNPGNLSPIVGLLTALAIWSLIRPQTGRFVFFSVLAGLLKYVSIIFIPVLVVMRRWRALAWMMGSGLAVVALSAAIMGIEPLKQFIGIFLSANRPWLGGDSRNQAVWSLIYQFLPQNPLPLAVTLSIKSVQWLVLSGLVLLMLRRRQDDWRQPSQVLAACAGMLAWLLIFSPIYWMHYILYLTPLVGWLAWEARSSWPARTAAAAAVFFIAAPYTNGGTGLLSLDRYPMLFHGLFAAVLVLGLSARRLLMAAAQAVPAGDAAFDAKPAEPARRAAA